MVLALPAHLPIKTLLAPVVNALPALKPKTKLWSPVAASLPVVESPMNTLAVGLVRISTVLKESVPVAEILPETVNLSLGCTPIPSLVLAASKIKAGAPERILGVERSPSCTNIG